MAELRVVIPDELDDYIESHVRTGTFSNKAEMARAALTDYIKTVTTQASDYDQENIFSPEGRIYQMEYAREAGYRGLNLIGLETEDEVILAYEVHEPDMAHGVDKVVITENDLLIGGSGLALDMVKVTKEIERYDINCYKDLRYTIADIYHEYTVRRDLRPLGTTLLLGCRFDGEPHLYEVDASGAMMRFKATAIGQDRESLIDNLSDIYHDGLKEEEAEEICQKTFGEDKEITVCRL